MGNLEMIVEFAVTIAGVPGAALGLWLLVMKVKKEIPFVRTTEAQQLQAARLLRSPGASDGSEGLHPYERGLLYRVLAKTKFVSIREMELLLQLPDPYEHLDRLTSTRRFFDQGEAQAGSEYSFVECYRSAGRRRAAWRLVTVGYFTSAFLAVLPLLAVGFYRLLYVPEEVTVEQFLEIAGGLLSLLVISLPVFGYLVLECRWWLCGMRNTRNKPGRRRLTARRRGSRGRSGRRLLLWGKHWVFA